MTPGKPKCICQCGAEGRHTCNGEARCIHGLTLRELCENVRRLTDKRIDLANATPKTYGRRSPMVERKTKPKEKRDFVIAEVSRYGDQGHIVVPWTWVGKKVIIREDDPEAPL